MNSIEPKATRPGLRVAATAVMAAQSMRREAAESKFLVSWWCVPLGVESICFAICIFECH